MMNWWWIYPIIWKIYHKPKKSLWSDYWDYVRTEWFVEDIENVER